MCSYAEHIAITYPYLCRLLKPFIKVFKHWWWRYNLHVVIVNFLTEVHAYYYNIFTALQECHTLITTNSPVTGNEMKNAYKWIGVLCTYVIVLQQNYAQLQVLTFPLYVTHFAKTRHNDAFLEIQIFASLSSIYLKLCSVAIPMLYCKYFSSYKAR